MSLRSLTGRLRTLLGRTQRLGGFDADVEAHLSLLEGDLERQGFSPEEARREARRRFGGVDQTREAFRDASGFPALDAIAQDVQYGLRMMRRQPGFSLLIVALVAVGVGANTAIFSLVNAILLRPLPYPAHDRLVVVRSVIPATARTYPTLPAAAGEYLLWRSPRPGFRRARRGAAADADDDGPRRTGPRRGLPCHGVAAADARRAAGGRARVS